MKKTIAQELSARRISCPLPGIYRILVWAMRLLYQKKLDMHFQRDIDVRKIKGPFIVVSNHASRMDYLYSAFAFEGHRLNFVAGYNEFFRSHLKFILRFMQAIPKKNFTPDMYAMREMRRVIKKGGALALFPEGMSSISGANQPVAVGTGSFLKAMNVPVYMTLIKGGYLTNTKYCLDERRGKVHVVVDQLFTVEELEALTVEEIQDKLHAHLCQDDYAWNKKARVAYDGHGQMAQNMHDLLYKCPKCGKEFTMHGEGNTIVCKECGNGATVNEYYDLIPLDDTCIIPETPRVWFDMERKAAAEAVKDPDFTLTEKVQLGMIPPYEYLKNQATSEIVGEGILTLDKTGITYRGSRRGEEVELHMPIAQLPTYGMCTDVSRFYTFFDGEFCEFFPEGRTVGKWRHCTEEMHRHMGGKWQNFPDAETRYDKM